jgi:hypothetical protein
MICKKCKSKWEADQSISASLVSCPFCGASLNDDEGEPKTFDTSKETLAFIMEQHGSEVLLSDKLMPFFKDYAPHVPANMKGLVFAVYEKGAAQILKSNLAASQSDKEIAFNRAVGRLTEAFIAEAAAKGIIHEFTDALGWTVAEAVQTPQQATPKPAPPAPAPQQKVLQTSPVPQTIQKPEQSSESSIPTVGSTMKFGQYDWRVLDVQSGRALLLTEKIIEERPYHSSDTNVTWEDVSCVNI